MERAVQYVKQNFLATFEGNSVQAANREVRQWCLETAGLRVHGTTKCRPLDRFEQTERAVLKPLPVEPYDLAIWRKVTCHRDGYVVFENAYYSAPYRLVGQKLMLRAGVDRVRLYTAAYQLVTSHPRAREAGERHTNLDHLPATHLEGLLMTRDMCLEACRDIGAATCAVVTAILADTAVDRLPTARRLLRLRERFGDGRLEAACQRANQFGDPTYGTVKRILVQKIDCAPQVISVEASPPATQFARKASEILGKWTEGLSWN